MAQGLVRLIKVINKFKLHALPKGQRYVQHVHNGKTQSADLRGHFEVTGSAQPGLQQHCTRIFNNTYMFSYILILIYFKY